MAKVNRRNHERIRESQGGELADWTRRLRGGSQECIACGSEFDITVDTQLWGFPEPEGVVDESGTAWWIYVLCPVCEFEITFDLLAR